MTQKKWYQMTPEEAAETQQVNPERGLAQEEAIQRLEQRGRNELTEGAAVSPITLFF